MCYFHELHASKNCDCKLLQFHDKMWRDHTGVDNIKTDSKEIVCMGVDWIHLAQDMVECWALANTVMNLWFPQKVGRPLPSDQLLVSQEESTECRSQEVSTFALRLGGGFPSSNLCLGPAILKLGPISFLQDPFNHLTLHNLSCSRHCSGIQHRVVQWKSTDSLEERTASIFRVKE
jgi:hypothetical protein